MYWRGRLLLGRPASPALSARKMWYFSCRKRIARMQQAVEQKILSRIYGNGRGWAFSQADFAGLGPRPTIDSALHRREREGVIRRVIRGIYDYPRHSKALRGPVSPDIDQVAHALARKFAWRSLSAQVVQALACVAQDNPARVTANPSSASAGTSNSDSRPAAWPPRGDRLGFARTPGRWPAAWLRQ